MIRITFCICLFVFVPAICSAQKDPNPYLSAKVGDWGKYELTTYDGHETHEAVDYRVVTKVQNNIVSVSVRFDSVDGREFYWSIADLHGSRSSPPQ